MSDENTPTTPEIDIDEIVDEVSKKLQLEARFSVVKENITTLSKEVKQQQSTTDKNFIKVNESLQEQGKAINDLIKKTEVKIEKVDTPPEPTPVASGFRLTLMG